MQIRVGDASFRLKNVPFMTNVMLKFAVLRSFLVYDDTSSTTNIKAAGAVDREYAFFL